MLAMEASQSRLDIQTYHAALVLVLVLSTVHSCHTLRVWQSIDLPPSCVATFALSLGAEGK